MSVPKGFCSDGVPWTGRFSQPCLAVSLISVSDGEGTCPGPNKDTRATCEGGGLPISPASQIFHQSTCLLRWPCKHSPLFGTVLTLSLTNVITGPSCHQPLLQPPSPFSASDTLPLVHSICLDSGKWGTNTVRAEVWGSK